MAGSPRAPDVTLHGEQVSGEGTAGGLHLQGAERCQRLLVCMLQKHLYFIFFKDLFIYLDRKQGRKRGRETSMCGCLSHASYWGPGPQPRHVP